ncbi:MULTISPECIES: cupin domain-containing protein [Nitrosomonas]|uniref:Cupin domain-containing protein n=2 Tax=Nitrosomonas eutropha TaxID=916 RepID=A0ABX5M5Z9_9PROT|nr:MULTISPECIES: cupin domain-containing protein [Nitrosomonas]ABI60156.1 Cupin 2, conserved barrel domain protein [Nitrosomonas eutropha C91]MXS80847.1 cupin domain-containing protein [Nitrosomonas sp. GH22]PXV77578.1 Cupin domain-containing protein [Nitrosomonas eutropha]SDW67190.1 Cupin domain-containing protein [Nitrosomonas eutropha]SEJ14890.1 Cupin domain-containing protein [Nitrosomonas eutropha]
MDIYKLLDLITRQKESGDTYLEFLRTPSLSMGIYTLLAGSSDLQEPHAEDEVYYVAQGQASMRVGSDHRQISAGSIIFVAANVDHCFYDITEDLSVLVFFAPAEYTSQKPNSG